MHHTPLPTEEVTESEGDTFEMVKTPSSSILIEPANFLKESMRKENYEMRKGTISATFNA